MTKLPTEILAEHNKRYHDLEIQILECRAKQLNHLVVTQELVDRLTDAAEECRGRSLPSREKLDALLLAVFNLNMGIN